MRRLSPLLLLAGCSAEPLHWQPELELPCAVDIDCDDGEICREGECWVPCEADEDCPDGYRCGELVGTLDGQGVCL